MFRKLTFVLLAFGLMLTSCAPVATAVPTEMPIATEPVAEVLTEAPAATAIILTDGLQREVRLEAPAQRVVSLAPSLTEVLFAVGAGDQVVGRDEYSDFPEEALNVESIGSTYQTLNTEAFSPSNPIWSWRLASIHQNKSRHWKIWVWQFISLKTPPTLKACTSILQAWAS